MRKSFLSRLYRHSRIGFSVLILFVSLYALTLSKGMDMCFFPLNDMFSKPAQHPGRATVYAFAYDGQPVHYTHHAYWKKDLIETSLANYVAYLENDRKTPLDDFFAKREYPRQIRRRLVPEPAAVMRWPYWLLKYSGMDVVPDTLILRAYEMIWTEKGLTVSDSSDLLHIKNKGYAGR